MATVEEFWHCYNQVGLMWDYLKFLKLKFELFALFLRILIIGYQVKLASKLPCGHTYAVFKQGTMPDWEDAANVEGGRWMMSFEKSERSSRLDERWMEALLMTLGNHLSQIITGRTLKRPCVFVFLPTYPWSYKGVQVCVRGKQDRVEVWVGDISNMREVAGVGRRIKQQLGLGLAKMEFSIHTEEKEGFKGPCLTI